MMNIGGGISGKSNLFFFYRRVQGVIQLEDYRPPGGYFKKFLMEGDSNANWWILAQIQHIWKNTSDQELSEFQPNKRILCVCLL